jgi:hypothetical protein
VKIIIFSLAMEINKVTLEWAAGWDKRPESGYLRPEY